jgi:hypothetical protein
MEHCRSPHREQSPDCQERPAVAGGMDLADQRYVDDGHGRIVQLALLRTGAAGGQRGLIFGCEGPAEQ